MGIIIYIYIWGRKPISWAAVGAAAEAAAWLALLPSNMTGATTNVGFSGALPAYAYSSATAAGSFRLRACSS